jgi:hypothetical protein
MKAPRRDDRRGRTTPSARPHRAASACRPKRKPRADVVARALPGYGRRVTPAEEKYADALASAVAVSLQRDPVAGGLARLVIRWFEGPDYLTIHALGTEEERAVPSDEAWYPLEWPNADREIDRVDVIMQDESVVDAVEKLSAELEGGSWPWDEQPAPLVAAAQRLRRLVESSGVPTAPHFAIGTSHFEGWGPGDSVPRVNPRPVLDLLAERGLDPGE